METLKLQNPILINGKEYKSLNYDFDEITIELFGEAETRKFKLGEAGIKGATLELDYSMQSYLGMAAIIAVNPTFDFNDLERIKGKDLMGLYRVGRNFFKGEELVSSPEEILEEPSELTEKTITPLPNKSKKTD